MLGGSLDIRILGLLPIKLNRRLAITEVVLNTLESISERRSVPILEGIRTDQSVVKAARARQFLADYDPKSKALEDYEQLTDSILNHFRNPEVIAIDVKTA
jgi:cellulose biosynthesis protein BcsQ